MHVIVLFSNNNTVKFNHWEIGCFVHNYCVIGDENMIMTNYFGQRMLKYRNGRNLQPLLSIT